MAFKLGDRMIEKVLLGYAESTDGADFLYTLTQLGDMTINITAEANEHKDIDGNLVKKSYKNKAGTLEAKNAFVNTNIVAAASGGDVVYGEIAPITAPKIVVVPAGTASIKIDGAVEGTIKVTGEEDNKVFASGTNASATEYKYDKATNTLTLPTVDKTAFIVKFDRTVNTGALITNESGKFPGSCKLTLKVAYWDKCDKKTLKGCYLVLPSFQVSPEISIPLNAETQMDYKGDLETDYCGGKKTLYQFFDIEDDED